MLISYTHAAATMNFLRTLEAGSSPAQLARIYTSHEALVLDYEAGPLRMVGERLYSLSAHTL
ncbi:hypothetical protein ACWDKQ_06800 [Saccharopolyspora sp. NPDC000995]